MALFGSKKAPAKEKAASKEVAVTSEKSILDLSHILRRPRITEKASAKAEAGVYAFEVAQNANKKSIAAAIKAEYNVTPVKVAIVRVPTKQVFVRGKIGTTGGGKKAYIYLKKGETIEFV